MDEVYYVLAAFCFLASFAIAQIALAVLIGFWLRRNRELYSSRLDKTGRHDYWDSRSSIHSAKRNGKGRK